MIWKEKHNPANARNLIEGKGYDKRKALFYTLTVVRKEGMTTIACCVPFLMVSLSSAVLGSRRTALRKVLQKWHRTSNKPYHDLKEFILDQSELNQASNGHLSFRIPSKSRAIGASIPASVKAPACGTDSQHSKVSGISGLRNGMLGPAEHSFRLRREQILSFFSFFDISSARCWLLIVWANGVE